MGFYRGANNINENLVFGYDADDRSSRFYKGEPTTNLLPSSSINSLPTYGNGWGTYNTNQYCGNNGCGQYWDIPAISDVTNNIVTTVSNHQIRSFDAINPQTTGGGVEAGVTYLAKKISPTQFSLHLYNGSQDGSQGYLNLSTGGYKVHDSYWLDERVSINSTNFPTKWFGYPHYPNSALVKEIIPNGFEYPDGRKSDCIRLHWFRSDTSDGMAYGVEPYVTIGVPVTVSFYCRASSVSAVGKTVYFQNYNYGGVDGYNTFDFIATWGGLGEWVRNTHTFTPTHNYLISYWFPQYCPMDVDIANIQIEQKSHVTQFTTTSRSNTNSLIDLTRNSTIDLSNVSFDSTAHPVFDGTDDYISTNKTAPELGMYDSSYTAECVCYPTDFTSDRPMFGTMIQDVRQGLHLTLRNGTLYHGHYAADYAAGNADLNTWNHIVFVYNASNGTSSIYKNGVLQGTGSIPSFLGTTTVFVGMEVGGLCFKGQIKVAKIYNKVLSPTEIQQNFLTYKNRFNI